MVKAYITYIMKEINISFFVRRVTMKRELKENVYLDALDMSIVQVKQTLNLLDRLTKNDLNINKNIIEKDMTKSILDLELSLASMCILLRKMSENQFIILPYNIRVDMNSIIHSNRFEYDDHIIVYSQRGREEVDLDALMNYAYQVLKRQDI